MQYVSDLHIEFLKRKAHIALSERIINAGIRTKAKYLVLAGDIAPAKHGELRLFLRNLDKGPWERKFYVPGNHEYYSQAPYYRMEQELGEVEKETQVELLMRRRVELPEVTLLGCTLWSKLDPKYYAEISYGMNDFEQIKGPITKGKLYKGISLNDYTEWHRRDRDWLEEELAKPNTKPIWVVTHHLPSYQCIHPDFKGNPLNSAFATDMEEFFPQVKTWIFGHSHRSIDMMVGITHLVSNPNGYPKEVSGFDPEKVLPLP